MNPYYFNSLASHTLRKMVSAELKIPFADVYKAVQDFVIKDDGVYIRLQNQKLLKIKLENYEPKKNELEKTTT